MIHRAKHVLIFLPLLTQVALALFEKERPSKSALPHYFGGSWHMCGGSRNGRKCRHRAALIKFIATVALKGAD